MNTFPPNDRGPIIELRRYTAAAGSRADLARRVDEDLAPAFQQLGGIAIGQFCERERPDGVAWLRAFDTRAQRHGIGEAFDAQLPLANADADDDGGALVLTALDASTALALPSAGGESRGIVVAHILPVRPGQLSACTRAAEDRFADYHGRGVIEAAILVTPEHRAGDAATNASTRAHSGRAADHQAPSGRAAPGRSGSGKRGLGPVLVWLGIVCDDAALADLRPALDSAAAALAAAGLLAAPAEVLVLDPCKRSRLRWVGAASVTAPARTAAMAAA